MTEHADPARIARDMALFDALPPDLRQQVNEGAAELHDAVAVADRRRFFEVTPPADGGLQRKSRRTR